MIKRILIVLHIAFFFLFDLTFGYSHRTGFVDPVTSYNTVLTYDISNADSEVKEFSKLDASIERFTKKWGITGASVAVAKDGKLVYAKGFGYANIEEKEKMQPFHLLRVASVSKLVTAVTIMKLVEDGLLDLNQKVFGFDGILNDPIFLNYIDDRVNDITVKNLLNHSAGWTTRWGDHLFMHESIARQMNLPLPLSQDDIITFALAKRLHFQPGTRSSYNNLGYVILQRVIEKTSGESYESYVLKNIFNPIGVYDAFIAYNFDSLRYPLETRYYEVPEAESVPSFDGQENLYLKSRGGNDIRSLGAAGGWVISSVSLVKFLLAIENASDSKIISKKSSEIMAQTEPGIHPLGWRWVSSDGSKWRTGSFAGTSALAISRSDGVTFAFITNTSPWIGARFPYEVNRMMTRSLQLVGDWPDNGILSPEPTDELRLFNNFFSKQYLLKDSIDWVNQD